MAILTGNGNSFTEVASLSSTFGGLKSAEIFKGISYNIPAGKIKVANVVKNPTPLDAIVFDPFKETKYKIIGITNTSPNESVLFDPKKIRSIGVLKNPNLNDSFLFDTEKISQLKVIGPTNPTPDINLANVAKLRVAQVLKNPNPNDSFLFDPKKISQFKIVNNQLFSTPALDELEIFNSQDWYASDDSKRVIVGQNWPKQTLSGTSISLNVGNTTSTLTFQFPLGLSAYLPGPSAGNYLLLTDNRYGQSLTKTLTLTNNGGVSFNVQLGQVLFSGGTATGTGGSTGTVVGDQHVYTWTAPANVYNVAVVCVGAGGGCESGGAGGGGLVWANNISVVPGQSYSVYTGIGGIGSFPTFTKGGNSSFVTAAGTVTGFGGTQGTSPTAGTGGSFSCTIPGITFGGGNGGNGGLGGTGFPWTGGGGGGAGGYGGTGGTGGALGTNGTAGSGGGGGGGYGNTQANSQSGGGGGGVGVLGVGANGLASGATGSGAGGGGSGGSNGSFTGFGNNTAGGGAYGGGAGGFQSAGANGAVRIIWPATRVANGAVVRAFGSTVGTTTLATDSSSTISESLLIYTATVATAEIQNITNSSSFTVQVWDPEIIPQTGVRAVVAPTNARERLYYSTLVNTKYGTFIPFKPDARTDSIDLSTGLIRQSKYQNFVTQNSPLAPSDKLAAFDSSTWYRTDNPNLILVGSANPKNNTNNIVSNMTSESRNTSGSNYLTTITTNTYYGTFNGTSQYLTAGTTSSFNFLHNGTSDWTVEAWVYFNNLPGSSNKTVFSTGGNAVADTGISMSFGFNNSNNIALYIGGNGSTLIAYQATSVTVTTGQWYHIAWTFTTATKTINLYINGVATPISLIGSFVSSIGYAYNQGNAAYQLAIGRYQYVTPGGYFDGYISNLRIASSKIYTGNFTPSSPLNRIQSARNNVTALVGTETRLLTLQNITIVDNSTNSFTITNPNSVTTTLNPIYATLFANPFVNEYVLLTDAVTNNQALAPISAVTIPNTSSYVLTIANSYVTNLNNSNPWYVQLWDPEVIPQSKVITTLAPTNSREILYYVNLLRGNRNAVYFPFKNDAIGPINNISLNRVDNTILQSTVSTTLAPTNPRERLYYANLVRSKYGLTFAVNNPAGIPGADYKFDVNPMSNLASNYWTYFNNSNSVAVGQPSSRLLNFSTISTKIPSGSNTLLTVNNPTSGIPFITSGQTYYGTFNGSTQTLSFTSNSSYVLGPNNFTFEAWIRPTTLLNYISSWIVNSTVQSAMGITWFITAGGFLNWYDNISGVYLTSTLTVPANAWSHVAAVRENGLIKFYINGIPAGSASYTTNIIASFTVYIGSNVGTATTFFAGDISNFRIVNKAVYTGPFKPLGPLGTFQPSRINVQAVNSTETNLLALQTSSVTTDSSVNNFTITNTGSIAAPTLSNSLGSNAVGTLPVVNEYALITDTVTGNQALSIISAVTSTASSYTLTIATANLSNLNSTNNWAFSLWDPVIFPQTNVLTNIGPQSARENLYYAGLAKGRYGLKFPYDQPASLADNVLVGKMRNVNVVKNPTAQDRIVYAATSLDRKVQIIKSPTQIPTNYRLSIFDSQYWTYFNNINSIAVGTYNPKLINYSTISSKTTDGSNTVLTVNGPSSSIPYITSRQTYYASFNGSTQSLNTSTVNTTLALGTGDFTVECWFYSTANQGNGPYIFNKDGIAGTNFGEYTLIFTSNTTLVFNIGDSTGGVTTQGITLSNNISNNTWYHFAAVRQGITWYLYLNGQLQNPGGTAQTITPVSSNRNFYIGGQQGSTTPALGSFTGYVSNLRVVKGVAVYTGPFTPLGPLSRTQSSRQNIVALNGTETSLLTLQNGTVIDNSVNAFAITNTGSVQVTSSTALGTVPTINDYALITDTVTNNQALAQIVNASSVPIGTIQIAQGQVLFDGAGTRTDGGPAGTLTSGSGGYYTYSWTCPPNVYSISVVAVGGGGSGAQALTGATEGAGGGGGALAYRNNISVTPGTNYTVVVGIGGPAPAGSGAGTAGNNGGDSYFGDGSLIKAGGGKGASASINNNVGSAGGAGGLVIAGTGGAGGAGGYGASTRNAGGGGGAGGYAGAGGNGGNAGPATTGTPQAGSAAAANSGGGSGGSTGAYSSTGYRIGGGGGGGVGLLGIGSTGGATSIPSDSAGSATAYGGNAGSSGVNGQGGVSGTTSWAASNGAAGTYGGGSGGQDTVPAVTNGGIGALRIIWPAVKVSDGTAIRSFPSTLVTDQSGTFTDTTSAASYSLYVPTSSVANLNISNTWAYSLWDPEVMTQANVITNTRPTTARDNLYYATLAKGRYGLRFPFESPATTTDTLSINKVDNTILQSTVSTTLAPTNARERYFYSLLAKGRYGQLYPDDSPSDLTDLRSVTNLEKLKITANQMVELESPELTNLSIINSNAWYSPVNSKDAIAGSASTRQTIIGQILSINVGETTSIISFKSNSVWNYYPRENDHVLLTNSITGAESIAKILSISNNAGFNVVIPLGQALMVGNGTFTGTGVAITGSATNTYQYSWTCPENVFSVSAVAVGAGGGGGGYGGPGAGGGALAWSNGISVVPGQTYSITVGTGPGATNGVTSSVTLGSVTLTAGGGGGNGGSGGTYSVTGTSGVSNTSGGGNGGAGRGGFGGGGGGAGGYGGAGGDGGTGRYDSQSAPPGDGGVAGSGGGGGGGGGSGTYGSGYGGGGGGVGLLGVGANGVGGSGGPANGGPGGGGGGSSGTGFFVPTGGTYGGGGGGYFGTGGPGAVRIIWPALSIVDGSTIRAFGNGTNIANALSTDQSTSIQESLLIFTATVATSEIQNIIDASSCTIQPWDPSYIPQSLVTTSLPPTNPRENLYYATLIPGEYGLKYRIPDTDTAKEVVYDRDTKGLVVKFRTAALGQGMQDPSYKSVAPIQFWN